MLVLVEIYRILHQHLDRYNSPHWLTNSISFPKLKAVTHTYDQYRALFVDLEFG